MNEQQRGYINFPNGFFETLLALAAVGVLACIGAVLYGIWWLFMNVTITIGG
jgi:hypothetical protein